MKTSVSRAVYMALSTASLTAIVFAGSVHAQGAPIVYAGLEQHKPSPDLSKLELLENPARVQVPGSGANRVEFRYPGQPGVATPSVPPLSVPMQSIASAPFGVASAAAPAATQIVLKPATTAAVAAPVVSTATSGALSLASGLAKAPAKPIRIAAVQTQKPANTGKPLTLSRVKVNRDAPIGEERGLAGIYVDGFEGQPTANGEIFDAKAMTAAHPSLPLPSLVQVENEENGREVVVRVNDRGPFDGKRILELSPRAGTVLGMQAGSSANVRVRYLGPAPVKQNDQDFAAGKVEADILPPVALAAPAPKPFGTPSLPVADYGQPSYEAPVEPVKTSNNIGLGNVFIQAGAFADIANAQSLTSALGRGHSVKIEEARVNGGDYFRVLVGPFPNRMAAELYRSQLSGAGIAEGFLTLR